MLLRHLVLAILLTASSVISGADAKVPTPHAPVPVDAATAHRADRAAQEYLDQQERNQTPAAPEAIADLADCEVLLLECSTYLDQNLSIKAGESFLAAGKKMNAVDADQRKLLGARYRKASEKLTALSRRLLGDEAYGPTEETSGNDAQAPTK